MSYDPVKEPVVLLQTANEPDEEALTAGRMAALSAVTKTQRLEELARFWANTDDPDAMAVATQILEIIGELNLAEVVYLTYIEQRNKVKV